MEHIDQKINRLNAGESIQTSSFGGIVCTVERSGDGKTLRFIRTFENGNWEVYHKTRF